MGSAKLYVGNLSYDTSEASLRTLFAPHGEVISANLIIDRDSGRSKGFGFVEMGTPEEAQKAIAALDGTQLDGRALKVNEAKPQVPRESRSGGYGGGATAVAVLVAGKSRLLSMTTNVAAPGVLFWALVSGLAPGGIEVAAVFQRPTGGCGLLLGCGSKPHAEGGRYP